jgi:dipeptidyl aminopeptidase/acylaminoacyl peptidase
MPSTTFLTAALALALSAPLSTPADLSAQHVTPDARDTTPPAAPFDLSIRNIMRGPELYGTAPAGVRWSADSRWIYFTWTEPGSDWRTVPSEYRVRAVPGARPEKLTPAQRDSAGPTLAPPGAPAAGRLAAIEYAGDIYVTDQSTGAVRRLTRTVARESSPVVSSDGRRVYFARDDNAFAIDLASGLTTQLTDLKAGAAPPDSSASRTPQRARLAQQQIDLFAAIRDQIADDSIATANRRTLDSLRKPATVYVGRDRAIQSLSIAPNGRGVLITLRTPAKSTPVEIPYWVTRSGYTEPRKGRTKVGDAEARTDLAYLPFARAAADTSTSITTLHLFEKDSLAGYVAINGWNAAGTEAAFLAFSRDNKQRILYTLSSADGSLHKIETLADTAWVGGPCANCAGWYDGGKRIWYVSEATGYAHLYTAAALGGDVRQLTKGTWEVRDARLSRDGRTFDLITNDPSPFDEHLFSLPVNGGRLTRITTTPGRHDAVVSPDRRLVADVYSYVNRPPDLYIMPNTPGAPERQLTRSPGDEFLRQTWLAPKIVMVPASDGARVPAHIYRPEDFGVSANGAAVIFVHGAGYLHNVGNFWSEYPREYLFNQFLARHGYVVIDADYRASDGYGRDWRTAIYRHMGGRDLQDEVDVSKYLTSTYGIPANRIGIYGGSYGGFMTLMALFTAPDYFGAGAALRSVTDWAHYNQGYTSAILNLPQNDTLAYRQSSPIYFAAGLRAPLLMAHGMVDTNVNYEDIVRLTQRLIELGKTNWELASYPVESHGFLRPDSWTDEYTRIFNLFERTIGHH